jgi:hypothetical protein
MGLTRYLQPEFFFGASFCIVTTIVWGFLGEFSFSVEIRKKINSTKMKEIAKFWETTNFLFLKNHDTTQK